jgi:hypothetical protein
MMPVNGRCKARNTILGCCTGCNAFQSLRGPEQGLAFRRLIEVELSTGSRRSKATRNDVPGHQRDQGKSRLIVKFDLSRFVPQFAARDLLDLLGYFEHPERLLVDPALSGIRSR